MAAKTGQILALQLHGHLTVFQPLEVAFKYRWDLGYRSLPPSNLFIPPYVHSALSAGGAFGNFPGQVNLAFLADFYNVM